MTETPVRKKSPEDVTIALIGNPNVGKSTLFNALTGANQHTGNWPGKTVSVAQGRYVYKGRGYVLVDLPGTYSLDCRSEEEQVAVDFIRSGQADCVLIVGDATCLERNLNLALQVMALSEKLILCVNLLDEAARVGMEIDLDGLERRLGIPVIGAAAVKGEGLQQLREKLRAMVDGFAACHPNQASPGQINRRSAEIAAAVVKGGRSAHAGADRIVLGKWSGYGILLLLLLGILFLTISGANVLSQGLEYVFLTLEMQLKRWCIGLPEWLGSLLIEGIYDTVACVMAVMLPPLVIFYPLFSFLEDLGYLPRAAFLLDHSFAHCGGCGKQALTMAMGLGCNTVGILGCRIIEAPRQRKIALLTNNLTPCNGRFPTLITLITLFFGHNPLTASVLLLGLLILSTAMTLLLSSGLDRWLPRGEAGQFVLELPPYRRPGLKTSILQPLLHRTLAIVGRAVTVSAPAGIIIWCLMHVEAGGQPLLLLASATLEPMGRLLGMNGAIMLAFFLSFPANELFLPLLVCILEGSTALFGGAEVGATLLNGGITKPAAICMLLFTMFHWPCGTACLTIRRETGSWAWTMAAMALPTLLGCCLCMAVGLWK